MNSEETIIGAGPTGLYLGSKIKNSTIVDRKEKIGKPIQCTGIVTNQIEKFLSKKELKKCTINKIKETEIIGPNTKIELKIGTNYILDNTLFEEILYDKALKNGNEILLNHSYLRSVKGKHEVKNNKTNKKFFIKSEKIIGADGPSSKVAKEFSLMKKRKQHLGIQVRMKINEEEKIKFYPHIGKYAWYVPEEKGIARIGLTGTKTEFNTFIKRFKGKIMEKQAGIIPIHKPFTKTKRKNVVLLGDAGGHIKNTTGGGIIPGLKAVENYLSDGKEYKSLGKELYMHFLVHNTLNNATNKEWDKIIKASSKINSLSKDDRDNLLKMGPHMLKSKYLLKYSMKKFLSGKVNLF